MAVFLNTLRSSRGFALNTALLILMLLTIMGVFAVRVTLTETKIATNYKAFSSSFYAAVAGVEEARSRLRGLASASGYGGDPLGTDPAWSAYILSANGNWNPATDDPDYSGSMRNYIPQGTNLTSTTVTANSLQSELPYMVKVHHMREYDAQRAGHAPAYPHYQDLDGVIGATFTAASPGNIVYYGYPPGSASASPTLFTTSLATDMQPVEIVTVHSGTEGSSRQLQALVAKYPGPRVVSPLYARQNVTGNGSSMTVNGNNDPTCSTSAPSLPPVYTLSPAVTNLNGSPTMLGNPPAPVQGPIDIDIQSMVTAMKPSATQIITQDSASNNNPPIGSPTNFVTAYSNTSDPYNVNGLKLNNVTGYGILLVDGDLVLGGGFVWRGLILATGTVTFAGGGSGINIRGAVLGNQTIDINGGLDIGYNRCMIDNAVGQQATTVLSWMDVY